MELADNAVRAQSIRREQRIGTIPNAFRAALIQQFLNSEVTLQLEVGPVIERVAERLRHSLRPRKKFLPGLGVPGTVTFGDSVGPHRTPFVVIAIQPDLEEVAELAVFGDVFWRK